MHARKACLHMLIAFCALGAMAIWAKDGATPRTPAHPKLKLALGTRLELPPVFIKKDSFKVSFAIEAVAPEKFQRHRCLISANAKNFTLLLPKHQKWMLRGDTLTILSEAEVTLFAKHDSAVPLIVNFKFANLDHPGQPQGVATLIIGKPPSSNAFAAIQERAEAAIAKANAALKDSVANSQAVTSTSSNQVAVSDSTLAEQSSEESGNVMSWILIGLLLSGFAVMALLNFLSRKRSRNAIDRIEPIRMPETNGLNRNEERITSFESVMRRAAPMETKFSAPISPGVGADKEEEKILAQTSPSGTLPAATVVALAKTERGFEEITSLSGLQGALSQLCAVTAEVQKAVNVQYEALQKISTQIEALPVLTAPAATPQSRPRLQFAPEKDEAVFAPQAAANNRNTAVWSDTGAKFTAVEGTAEKYEEIADAIASLAAASTIKPPAVSAQALAPKLDLLRRTYEGLQSLAVFCQKNSTRVSAETVEALARKVLDLRTSYEAWVSDQSLKMPLLLQRPANGGDNARRKIVESLLDGLYETRKIAAQGSLYFERRLSQLLEQDLPKLRNQFSGAQDVELQKIWESMA